MSLLHRVFAQGDHSLLFLLLLCWLFVVECIKIIAMWTLIDPELPKDSNGSRLLRDGAHLSTAEELVEGRS
ncbi:hypothetical protein NA56DRAFT_648028 [Hyaloscypha hepaticicola]|uniref:Uncharacterized protein n=1 Tax=Hyaloscypha hepaticicola TaxID=2082293 RepID=A0A2J6PW53_9HELO|nr:hypothetical protein NA56DRAFT_648028 [Hyaloscypha hepaticicola]